MRENPLFCIVNFFLFDCRELSFWPKVLRNPTNIHWLTRRELTKYFWRPRWPAGKSFARLRNFYYPIGLWEPFKLQLKLCLSKLNGEDWDEILLEDVKIFWQDKILEFLQFPKMKIERCAAPQNAVDPGKICLLCLSDAAVDTGGAVIYASYLLKDFVC